MVIEKAATNRFDAGISDVILPAQYFGTMGATGLSSEQRLMLAVLVDAINILRGWQRLGSARKRRDFAEATHWVNIRGSTDPFSFDEICQALNIDPGVLRERLSDLAMGRANAASLGYGHLRIRQSSRAQHVTANRVRRRNRLYAAVIPA